MTYNVNDLTLEEAQKIIDNAPSDAVSLITMGSEWSGEDSVDDSYIDLNQVDCLLGDYPVLREGEKAWVIKYHIADVKKHIESLTCKAKPVVGTGNHKYDVTIHGKYGTGSCVVDVYRVLDAFNVTTPQQQHSIKKELKCGSRGHKDLEQDLIDIRDTAQSALDAFYDKQH